MLNFKVSIFCCATCYIHVIDIINIYNKSQCFVYEYGQECSCAEKALCVLPHSSLRNSNTASENCLFLLMLVILAQSPFFFFIKYQKFNINFQSEFSWMCCKLYPSFWRISAEKEDLSWLSEAVRDHNFNLDSRSSLLSLLTWTLHSHQRDACLKIPQKRGCRVYVYIKKITR